MLQKLLEGLILMQVNRETLSDSSIFSLSQLGHAPFNCLLSQKCLFDFTLKLNFFHYVQAALFLLFLLLLKLRFEAVEVCIFCVIACVLL